MKRTIFAALLATTMFVVPIVSLIAASSHTRLLSRKHTTRHGVVQSSPKKGLNSVVPQSSTTLDLSPEVIPGAATLTDAQIEQATSDSKAGQEAFTRGDLREAETDFRQATQLPELHPSNTDAIVGLAQTLEQEGKGQEAIKVYRYLLYPKRSWQTSLEDDPILRMHFALLLANDKQWPEAVFVYENTINGVNLGMAYPSVRVHFSPQTPELALFQAMVHLALGVTYNNRLEHTKALAEYQAAINAQPNFALAYYCHGHGLQRLGRGEEAAIDFKRAAALGDGEVKKAAQSPDGLLLNR